MTLRDATVDDLAGGRDRGERVGTQFDTRAVPGNGDDIGFGDRALPDGDPKLRTGGRHVVLLPACGADHGTAA